MNNKKRNYLLLILIFIFTISSKLSVKAEIIPEDSKVVNQLIETYYFGKADNNNDNNMGISDPYLKYYSKEEFENLKTEEIKNNNTLGVKLEVIDNRCVISEIESDSPAYKSGLQVNDIVREINGYKIENINVNEIYSLIEGNAGGLMLFKIERAGVILNYFLIGKQQSVTEKDIGINSNLYGYIKIRNFTENTSKEFNNVINKCENNNIKSYIIDLRGNNGGLINSALDIAGYFIGSDNAIIAIDRNGKKRNFKGIKHDLKINKPVILLTDNNTASASEILISALGKNKKAIILGAKTYGKGTMQTFFNLPSGAVLKLTILKFEGIDGSKIDQCGIMPDINTYGEDALTTVKLLLSGSQKSMDNYVKVNIKDIPFWIDLNDARNTLNKRSLEEILKISLYNGSIISRQNGSDYNINMNAINSFFPYNILYQSYTFRDYGSIKSNYAYITRTYESDVDFNTVNSDNISLVDVETMEQIPLSFGLRKKKTMIISSMKELTPDHKYLLITNDNIMSTDKQKLNKATIEVLKIDEK